MLATTLLAAACGSEDATTEAGSPIAEFLGQEDFFTGLDDEDAQARFAEEQRQQEELVASCMAEQGFEYTPVDYSDFNFAGTEDGLDFDSREYAEKYGFGITTQRYSQAQVGPDLVGWDDGAIDDEEDGFQDPNADYVNTLDEATQEAYYAALYGDEDDFPAYDPETMTEEELAEAESAAFNFEPQGCYGEAWANSDSGSANQFYTDFDEELTELYESIEDDPRITEIMNDVANCVSDSGYEYRLDQEFQESFYQQWDSRLAEVDDLVGFQDPTEGMSEEDFAAMSEEELEALFSNPPEMPAEAKAKLGELQAEETAMAVAVFDCGGSFGNEDLLNAYQEVAAEYEQQFLDDNADRLEDYRG
ncbi:MAG: hypothetical protein AAF547_01840 [Actinomycetota bacterium]